MAKTVISLRKMMTIKEIIPKKYLSGEGEGLFHRAISHSGTMLMPIDVNILCPNYPDKLLNF